MVTLKFELGVFLACLSFFSISLNLLIMVPVFKLAFIQKKSQVYIITFFNLITDILQMTYLLLYGAPTIIFDHYLVSDHQNSPGVIFMGGFFIALWFMEGLVQVMMSTNRYVVICLRNHNIFTFRSTSLLLIPIVLLSSFTAYIIQYVTPCCDFIFDQAILSYNFIRLPGHFNYSDYFFIMPIDATCSTIAIICYSSILYFVKKSSSQLSSTVQCNRRKNDIRYTAQFFLVNMFYTLTWSFFVTFPYTLKNQAVEWYFMVPFMVSLNCCSNAVVYLTVNKEVKKNLSCGCLSGIFGLTRVFVSGPKSLSTSEVRRNTRTVPSQTNEANIRGMTEIQS